MNINRFSRYVFAALAVTAILSVLFLPQVLDLASRLMKRGDLQHSLQLRWQRFSDDVAERIYRPEDDAAYWQIEDAKARADLPLYKHIPAPEPASFAPSTGWPGKGVFTGWSRSYGNHANNRYVASTALNRASVAGLRPVWEFHTEAVSNVQANPVVFGDSVIFPASDSTIVSLDNATGDLIWRFDPKAKSPAKRGLLLAEAAQEPRVFFAAGGYLYSLSAKTGAAADGFGKSGRVRLGARSVTAPARYQGLLIQATLAPDVRGYDLVTGALRWVVSLDPENKPPRAAGLRSKYKGGRPWSGLAVDPSRGLAFVTTANPGPLFGTDSPGRNPLSVSVVAIDLTKGRIAWDFQEIAHDLWDLDIAAPPLLATITRGDRQLDVVVAVTKAGNTLVLDRETGVPVFGQRLRRTPTSTIPGERTAAYQPDYILPQPFARQVFSDDDLWGLSPASKQNVQRRISGTTFGFFAPHVVGRKTVFYGLHGGAMWPGPALDPDRATLFIASSNVAAMTGVAQVSGDLSEANLPETAGRIIYLDSCAGCHGDNREGGDSGPALIDIGTRATGEDLRATLRDGLRAMPPVALDAQAQLDVIAYLTSRDAELRASGASTGKQHSYRRLKYEKLRGPEGYPGVKPPWGTLSALDLNTGVINWQVPLGEHAALIAKGMPPTGTENFGAPLVTAGGLVFVAGTKDRLLRAFDVRNGLELWRHELPFVASGPPSYYERDGKPYLLVPATGGGTLRLYDKSVTLGSSFVAFSLP